MNVTVEILLSTVQSNPWNLTVTWLVQVQSRKLKLVLRCFLLTLVFSELCGGPGRLSVYANGPVNALPVPTAQITGLPGNWQYKGCLR